MTTMEMVKFWLIRDIGVPVLVIGSLCLVIVTYAVVCEVVDWFRRVVRSWRSR